MHDERGVVDWTAEDCPEAFKEKVMEFWLGGRLDEAKEMQKDMQVTGATGPASSVTAGACGQPYQNRACRDGGDCC